MGRLDDVAAALAVDDLVAVRDGLDQAWHVLPSARIGKLVAALDGLLPREAIEAATVAQRERTWLELAGTRDPRHLTKLVCAPWPPHANQCTARIQLLAQWPRSPRIANALLALCEREEIQSRSMQTLLRLVVNTLLAQGDPRVSELLERIETQGDPGSRNALRAILARRKRPVEPAAEPEDVAVLDAVSARVAPRVRAARTDLLAAVYATPHDDGPREVYADLLVEERDPRGELIVMQLRRARGERGGSQAREAALLRAGGKAYYDGLDADGARDITLARGFPVRAALWTYDLRAPAWATIETLILQNALAPRFDGSPLLVGLRRLCGLRAMHLPQVALPAPELDFLSVIGSVRDATTTLAPRVLGLRYPGGSLASAAWREEMLATVPHLPQLPIGRRVTGLAFDGTIDHLPLALEVTERAPGITELRLAQWATEDREPLRWTVRLADGHLRLDWYGREQLDTFRAAPLVLARLPPSQVARVTGVEIVAHAKLATSDLDPTRDGLRRIVAAWPSVTDAQILV